MTVITNFHWEPDPVVYANSMNNVADALLNRTAPLAAASEAVQMDIRERFETETDPSGRKWEPWSESYRHFAEIFPNMGILHQTGALEEAATSTEATQVTNDSVFYSTQNLPSHGLEHESGNLERDPPLPQRSFLGLSDAARTVIMGNFYEWFEGAISLFVTSRGRIGRRHSITGAVPGMRGRPFIPRSAVGRGPLS